MSMGRSETRSRRSRRTDCIPKAQFTATATRGHGLRTGWCRLPTQSVDEQTQLATITRKLATGSLINIPEAEWLLQQVGLLRAALKQAEARLDKLERA